jgi:hypothetical protein
MNKILSLTLVLLLAFAQAPVAMAATSPIFAAPVATSFSATTAANRQNIVQLQGSDADGTALTYAIVGNPSHGALSGFNAATGTAIYTPVANYVGADSFTYTVTSGGDTSAAGTVTLTVSNAKTRIRDSITDPGGGPASGKVTFILTQTVTAPDGLIPVGTSVSASLTNGVFDLSVYPSRLLSPAAYYQVYYTSGAGKQTFVGVYDIPLSTTTINLAPYKVLDTNLAAQYTFASQAGVASLTAAVTAAALSQLVGEGRTTGRLQYWNGVNLSDSIVSQSGSTVTVNGTLSATTYSNIKNAELPATLSGKTLTTATLAAPTITGGTQSGVTLTMPTITTPAITGGTQTGTTISGASITSPSITNPTITGTTAVGNINSSGTVTANSFVGNGAGITGLAGATGGVTNTGSTTIGADTNTDGVGVIDLQIANQTVVRVNAAGLSTSGVSGRLFFSDLLAGSDVGAKVNAAGAALGSTRGTIIHTGGGVISTPIELAVGHNLVLSGVYTTTTTNGALQPRGNNMIELMPGTVIEQNPTVTMEINYYVIVAYNTATENGRPSKNIHIRGGTIRGAGNNHGAAAGAITLGNCHNCSVRNMTIDGVRAIGIAAGASSTLGTDPESLGRYATEIVVENVTFKNVRSQCLACVNCSHFSFRKNYFWQQDSRFQSFTVIDLEPNEPTDLMSDGEITGNWINLEGSTYAGAINGIGVQGVSGSTAKRITVTGNQIIGGAHSSSTFLTLGILVSGTTEDLLIADNFIKGANSAAIRLYETGAHLRPRIRNNEILNSGAGGSYSVEMGSVDGGRVADNFIALLSGNGDPRIVESGVNTVVYKNNDFLNYANANIGIVRGASSSEYGTTLGAGTTIFSSVSLGGTASWTRGAGAPAGVCTTGSIYSRTDGGVGTSYYVCESAAWVAK